MPPKSKVIPLRLVRSHLLPTKPPPLGSDFHWNAKNITGQRFGKLVVIEEAGRAARRSLVWKCHCDCGRDVLRVGSTLLCGKSTSCGCFRHDVAFRAKIAKAQIRPHSAFNRVYRAYCDAAKARDRIFQLSRLEFEAVISRPCAYCGAPPAPRKQTKYASQIMNGIDRVDNSQGYTVENCVPCCSPCNLMKLKLGRDEFLSRVWRIASYQGFIQEAKNA